MRDSGPEAHRDLEGWRKIFSSHREVWTSFAALLPLLVWSRLEVVIDQSWASRISPLALDELSIVVYTLFAFRLVGLVFGRAAWHSTRTNDRTEGNSSLSRAVHATFVATAILAILFAMLAALPWTPLHVLIGQAPPLGLYLVAIASLVPTTLNVVIKFHLLAKNKTREAFLPDALAGGLAFVLKFAAVSSAVSSVVSSETSFTFSPATKIMALFAINLAAQSALFAYYARSLKLTAGPRGIGSFFARAKRTLETETSQSILLVLEPLAFGAAAVLVGHPEILGALAVGFSVYSLLLAPVGALQLSGISKIAATVDATSTGLWNPRLKALFAISIVGFGLPVALVSATTDVWLPIFFGIAENQAAALVACFTLAALPAIASLTSWCLIDVAKKRNYIPTATALTTYVSGLPIFVYGLLDQTPLWAAIAGFAVSKTLRATALYLYGNRVERERRIRARISVVLQEPYKIRLRSVDGDTADVDIFDVSDLGCGVLSRTRTHWARPGTPVFVELLSGGRLVAEHGGVIRRVALCEVHSLWHPQRGRRIGIRMHDSTLRVSLESTTSLERKAA